MRRGSTSAPARNVRRIPPNEARKSIQGVVVTPKKFPAITPSVISMIATEMPSSTLSIEAPRIENPRTVAVANVLMPSSSSLFREGLEPGPYPFDR